jgi:DNA polymerase-1
MQWQELPEIAHPSVKLGANLGIFWPSWAKETVLPNNATAAEIYELAQKTKEEIRGKSL